MSLYRVCQILTLFSEFLSMPAMPPNRVKAQEVRPHMFIWGIVICGADAGETLPRVMMR
jgi:hypothetical protein